MISRTVTEAATIVAVAVAVARQRPRGSRFRVPLLSPARLCTDMTTEPVTTTSTIEHLLDIDQVADRLASRPGS